MYSFYFFLLINCFIFHQIFCENILLLVHLQGSHVAEMSTVGEELTRRGYKVYTVIPATSNHTAIFKRKGIQVIHFNSQKHDVYMESDMYNEHMNQMIYRDLGKSRQMFLYVEAVSTLHCSNILRNETLKSFLKQLNFSVAFVDTFIGNYCFLLVPKVLEVPFVSITTVLHQWDYGIPGLPSFVPAVLHDSDRSMSSKDKIISLLACVFINSPLSPLRRDTKLLVEFGQPFVNWVDLSRKAKAVIHLRNELMEWPVPSLPHVLHLPGVTYETAKHLPSQIDQIYASAQFGVILMSFGSTAGIVPPTIFKTFVDAFKQLNMYEVIWKFPPELLQTGAYNWTEIPTNVHLLKWLPQNDCLGHNKTLVFITHCGNNGQYEALYHGVPMIGFPLFADQFHNAFRIVKRGYGLQLDVNNLRAEDLVDSIHNVIGNSSFKANTLFAKKVLLSQPHPKQVIANMIELVSRHGADHLRSSAVDMPWYQLIMLDVFLVMIIIFSMVMLCIAFCIKRILRLVL